MRLSKADINRRGPSGHDGRGVSVLLGSLGFVVVAQLLEEETGEWWLAVETTAEFSSGPDKKRAWCPSC
jgi:hypothetical protein